MSRPPRHPAGETHPALLLAGLLLVTFNLRTPIVTVPPLLSRIQHDLGLSGAAAGALTGLPVICMGLFAPPAQRLAARIGREATISWAVLCIVAGTAARLGGGALPLLYGGTLLAGIGIAVTQTAVPSVVKEHFAHRSGLLTGLYSTTMAVGATIGAGVAVPLAQAAGSWTWSLAIWALPALAALALWRTATLGRAPGNHQVNEPGEPSRLPGTRIPLPWRSPTAWLISVYLGVQSLLFYSQLAWISPMLQQQGWSPDRAGLALSLFNLLGIVGSLLLPPLAGRLNDRRAVFSASLAATVAGLIGLTVAPASLTWLWIALAGVGQGGAFSLGLLLLVDHAPDPASSSRLSAMGFLVAYSFAAIGPVVIGAVHDVTGSFTAAFAVLAALGVVEWALTSVFSPARRRAGV